MKSRFRQKLLLVFISIFITACSPKLTCNNKDYLDEMKDKIHETALSQIGNVHPSVREAVQKSLITFDSISEPTKVSDSEVSCNAQVSTQYTFVQDGKSYTSTHPLDYYLAITSNENGDKQASYMFDGSDIIASLVGFAKEDDKFSWTWKRFGNSQTKPEVTANTENISPNESNDANSVSQPSSLATEVVPQNPPNNESTTEEEPYELPDETASAAVSQSNP